LYRPVEGVERQPTTCFVGQRYADREKYLAALVDADVPIDIYGTGWRGEDGGVALPEGATHLGRDQIRPGTLESYYQLVTAEVRRQGALHALRRVVCRATYKWQRRAWQRKLLPHVKGRAVDLPTVFAAHELCVNFSNVWADGAPGSALIPHV